MILESVEDIRARLQSDTYRNSDQVRLAVVARIIQELGWNIWDPAEVAAGYGETREDRPPVDYALCAPSNTPAVFISVSSPGAMKTGPERAENILREHHADVPVAVAAATDGRLWKLYSPQDEGSFPEICFKTLDLLDDEVSELESAFTAYLSKEEISNGNALRAAKSILWQKSFSQTVLEILPAARRMVTEPPYPRLPEAVATLAAQRGFTVTEEEAVKILTGLESKKPAQEPAPTSAREPSPHQNGAQDYSRRNIKSFRFRDTTYTPATWKEMLVKFCMIIQELQGDDFHKCLSIGINNKSVFSKNVKDLFGNAPMQIGKTEYYVMTNFTANHIVQLVHRIMDMFSYKREDIEIVAE